MPPHPAEDATFGSLLSRWLPWLAGLWLAVYWLSFFSDEMPNSGYDRLDVLLLLPEIYWGLLFPESRPNVPSGWRYLPQRLDVLACAGLIVLAGLASGRLLLRGLRVFEVLDPVTRLAFAGGLGLSAVSLFTLLCGVAGALHWGLFVAVFVALVSAETGIWWNSRGRHRKPGLSGSSPPTAAEGKGRAPGEKDCPRWLKIVCLAVCVPFLCCMLLGSMLPSTDFDVKEYHLQGPKEFFLDGRVGFLPHNVYTSFPFLTEMLSLAGMVVRGDWFRGALVGKVVLMTFAPLTALGVFAVARGIAGPAAGWLGAAVYLSTPWTYRISIIAYAEGGLCCYVVLTLLGFAVSVSLIRSRETPADSTECGRRFRGLPLNGVFLTGLLAGSAVATKYPGMVLVAIPFALAVCALGGTAGTGSGSGPGKRPIVIAQLLACYGLGVLLTFGPWMTKNLVETGNPVYPLMYSVFGGAGWDAERNERWKHAHSPPLEVLRDPRRWPADLKANAVDVALKNDWQSPLLFGLVPLAFLWRGRRRAVLFVAGYALIMLGVWYVLTHRIDRFWVPVIPVLSVLAGVGLATTLPAPGGRGGSGGENAGGGPLRWLVAGLVGLAVVYNFGFITTRLAGYNAYLIDSAAARRETMTPSLALIERLDLPETSKVLFVGEAQVFDATFPHLYNTVFDQNLLERMASSRRGPGEWELLNAGQIRENLQKSEVTHLFVNWNEILRYRTTYGYTDFISPRRMRQLVDMEVIRPAPLPPEAALRPWETLDESWQREVASWGPALRREHAGRDALLQYELFEVR